MDFSEPRLSQCTLVCTLLIVDFVLICSLSKGDAPSDYVTAMRSIGSTLADFDPSREFAPYGFGAKLPPSQTISSDCFSVVGDYFDPKIIGGLREQRRVLTIDPNIFAIQNVP